MVPYEIHPYFKQTSQKNDGYNEIFEGVLQCCGSNKFEVFVFGEIKYSFLNKMWLYPKNDIVALSIRCIKCGKIISIFIRNDNEHYYDNNPPFTYSSMKSVKCKKCYCNIFEVKIKYEYPSIKELEELNIKNKEEEYSWIWVTLKCNNCGTIYKNFLNYETL